MRKPFLPTLALVLLAALVAPVSPITAGERHAATSPDQVEPAAGTAPWTHRIDLLVKHHAISVVVGQDGTFLYRYKPLVARAPASNEKLLLSMAILDELGPDFLMTTRAAAENFDGSVVNGDLWILGAGDPEVGPGRMGKLAHALASAGVTKIQGSVRGSITYFSHDWWAPGWKRYFPATEVALPTALAFNYNTANGVHIRDPERRAAVSLTKALRSRGIKVTGKPRAGKAPSGLTDIASIDSAPLVEVLRRQDVSSINFYAETLGKLLGANVIGRPGTIAKGAKAIDRFAASNDAPDIDPNDSSGLSYGDRVTADNLVRLLWYSDAQSWASDLRWALPTGGEGTLSSRLGNVFVRAKTGTLTGISALSGWVKSETSGDWVEFSILSKGMSKSTASHIEDRIVTIVANTV